MRRLLKELDTSKRKGPNSNARTPKSRASIPPTVPTDDKNKAAAAANIAFSSQYSGRRSPPVYGNSFLTKQDDYHLPKRNSSPPRHNSPVQDYPGQRPRSRSTSQSRLPRHEPSPSNTSSLVGSSIDRPPLEPQERNTAYPHQHSHSLSDLPAELIRPVSRDGARYDPSPRDGVRHNYGLPPALHQSSQMANSDIQAELSRSENQIELLQNENKALKEGIQDRSLAIRQLEDALSSQEMESRSLKADLSRLEDDQMKSLYNLRDRHESERLKQAAYYEEKLHSFQDDHDQELLRNEKFLKDRHDQHERELSNQKAMHEETIHTLYEEHKREFSKQESKHQKTLQDLRDKHALDVAKEKQEAKAMSEGHQKELHMRINDYKDHIKHLKTKMTAQQSSHEQEIKSLRMKHEEELQALQQSHELTAGDQQRKFDAKTQEYKKMLKEIQFECDRLVEDRMREKKDHEAMISALHSKYNAEASQLRRDFEEKSQQQKSDHALQMQNQRIYYSTESDKTTATYESQMQSLMEENQAKLQMTRDYYEDTMRVQGERHQSLVKQEREEHTQMVASLRPETGDSIRQLTDSELKIQFQKLKLLVQVITEPFNLGAVSVPQDSQLDHTGFIQRKGKNMLRFLLRSLVWERIVDGFFSAPFGFGAFGSGDGKRVLIELYWSWRSLFAHHGGAGAGTGTERPSPAETSLDIFSRSKDANRWRSATFSSIMSAVRDAKKSPVDGDEPAPLTPYAMNQAKVETDILKVFEEITTAEAVDQIKDKVSEIACLAGELALEVGVHRANVGLLLLSSGESVQIGQDFVDCEDGHGAQGDLETVDLLVCPQLFKIGDGRGEGSPSTPKSICPGEVYPVRFMPA